MVSYIEDEISKEKAKSLTIGDTLEFDKLTETGGIVLGRYEISHISENKDGSVTVKGNDFEGDES